jgi:hypothetical protein
MKVDTSELTKQEVQDLIAIQHHEAVTNRSFFFPEKYTDKYRTHKGLDARYNYKLTIKDKILIKLDSLFPRFAFWRTKRTLKRDLSI